ncbi:MAG: methionine biosynthesis protein MetW, partial [Rhizobiales bacterium 35-66-30]
FVALVEVLDARMEKAVALDSSGHPVRFNMPWWVWNLLGEQAVFLLSRND